MANVEQGDAVSFRTLERVAKGLGIRYKTLLALARGEISKLDEEAKPKFRMTITIEGDMEEEALRAHRDFLNRIATVIKSLHPFGEDRKITRGSVHISVTIDAEDVERACHAFVSRQLEQLGIRQLEVELARERLNVLLTCPDERLYQNLDGDPSIFVTSPSDFSAAISMLDDPALNAVVVDLTHMEIYRLSEAEFPLKLAEANSRGVLVLIFPADRHPQRLYSLFPSVQSRADILPKLIEWSTPPLQSTDNSKRSQTPPAAQRNEP